MDAGLTFNEVDGGMEVFVLGGDEQLSLLHRDEKIVAASCWHSSISDNGLRYLIAIPNLRELLISVPFITWKGLAELSASQHLRKLHVRFDRDDDQCVCDCANAVSRLTQLEVLGFRANRVSGLGTEQFAKLRNVWMLEMSGTDFADSDALAVSLMPSLTKISLASCCISDSGLAHLSRVAQLRSIDVGATRITDRGLMYLAGNSALTDLHVSHNHVTDAAILAIAQSGSLEVVSAVCTEVGDGIAQVPRLCPNLRSLNVYGSRVSQSVLEEIEREFPDLQVTY